MRQRFRVTHPFHPLRGEEFEAYEVRQVRGYRIFLFKREDEEENYVPVSWTDAGRVDAFEVISEGRAHFRIEDLLEIWRLIREEKQ